MSIEFLYELWISLLINSAKKFKIFIRQRFIPYSAFKRTLLKRLGDNFIRVKMVRTRLNNPKFLFNSTTGKERMSNRMKISLGEGITTVILEDGELNECRLQRG